MARLARENFIYLGTVSTYCSGYTFARSSSPFSGSAHPAVSPSPDLESSLGEIKDGLHAGNSTPPTAITAPTGRLPLPEIEISVGETSSRQASHDWAIMIPSRYIV